MKNTDLPLDIIFINSDWIVTSVVQGAPNTEDILSGTAQYVLELNQNSGVQSGDEVELDDPDEWYEGLDTNKMYIIGSDGEPQMKLDGGERIFSQENTKTLVKMAKRAFLSKRGGDYKRLGRKLFEYLKTQDTNKPEYVSTKKD